MKKMQMIRAIIRPGLESKVVESLEKEGCISLTKMEVFGRGKQKGLHITTMNCRRP
jgi:nitrogen regulatory protein PII 1